MRRILRFFGLVPVKDVIRLLDKEAEFYIEARKKLSREDALRENYDNMYSHYAQCCKGLKGDVWNMNK